MNKNERHTNQQDDTVPNKWVLTNICTVVRWSMEEVYVDNKEDLCQYKFNNLHMSFITV